MQKFDFLKQKYRNLRSVWSTGYFAVTVSAGEETIRRYIKYQQQEDLGQAKLAL